ncbi:MAG: Spy/CpxP family protein refolding chaperone [Xanthobacteraceae bacterium]|nr:Spy/CpxP family protein refolding chaperone [Xanthobacteraceae bacterium]
MKKLVLATLAALTVAGSTAVYAHQRPWADRSARVSAEDRAALTDARLAAIKAGLKLTADQEKLWPPVETAVRDFTKLRADRANARRQARQAGAAPAATPDPVARLSARADAMAATAAALKKIADAADPLYKTLDDGQKQRLALLTRMERRMGRGEWRDRRHHEHRFRHEWRDRRGTDRDGDNGRL